MSKPRIECPTTYHPCLPDEQDDHFRIVDYACGGQVCGLTEDAARRVAERRFPGCELWVTTLTSVHGRTSDDAGTPDTVVVGIFRRVPGGLIPVGYVDRDGSAASCVPFRPDSWPSLRQHLPCDARCAQHGDPHAHARPRALA